MLFFSYQRYQPILIEQILVRFLTEFIIPHCRTAAKYCLWPKKSPAQRQQKQKQRTSTSNVLWK